MADQKFCPHCGTQVNPGTKFCPNCGQALTETTQDGTTAQATASTTTTGPQATENDQDQTTRQAAMADTNPSDADFNARVDAMVAWVTNNWATSIVVMVVLFLFTLMTDMMFGHIWLGLIALIAVVVWLYSYSWTHGSATTESESKLHHLSTSRPTTPQDQGAQANGPQQGTTTSQTMSAATVNGQPLNGMGQPDSNQPGTNQPAGTNVYVNQAPATNGMGLAGFILALIALFTSWIPMLDWFLWFLGALFSLIGIFKRPRGFAIAGLVISFIDVILILVVLGSILGGLAMFGGL